MLEKVSGSNGSNAILVAIKCHTMRNLAVGEKNGTGLRTQRSACITGHMTSMGGLHPGGSAYKGVYLQGFCIQGVGLPTGVCIQGVGLPTGCSASKGLGQTSLHTPFHDSMRSSSLEGVFCVSSGNGDNLTYLQVISEFKRHLIQGVLTRR